MLNNENNKFWQDKIQTNTPLAVSTSYTRLSIYVGGILVLGWGLARLALSFPGVTYYWLTLIPLAVLTVLAVHEAISILRFGTVALELNPFPGSIGGEVGGSLELPISYKAQSSCEITLTCNSMGYNYVEDRYGRRRLEKTVQELWRSTTEGHVTKTDNNKTSISFIFSPPEYLPATILPPREHKPKVEDYFIFWTVEVDAKIPGINFIRTYNIPVLKTNIKSTLKFVKGGQQIANSKSLQKIVEEDNGFGVMQIKSKLFRRKSFSLMTLLFSLTLSITISLPFFIVVNGQFFQYHHIQELLSKIVIQVILLPFMVLPIIAFLKNVPIAFDQIYSNINNGMVTIRYHWFWLFKKSAEIQAKNIESIYVRGILKNPIISKASGYCILFKLKDGRVLKAADDLKTDALAMTLAQECVRALQLPEEVIDAPWMRHYTKG